MRIGITGHQRLPDSRLWTWVRSQIDSALDRAPAPIVGISSLASGADQLFAQSVLDHGGTLEVIIPFSDYEERFAAETDRQAYRALLDGAARCTILHRTGSDEEAYYAAGRLLVESSDLLLAVWDAKPAKGLGGTGDIVRYAVHLGKPVLHIDPIRMRVGSPER